MAQRSTPLVIDMPSPATSVMTPLAESAWLDNALFAGVCVLLMFGPLAFGGNDPWMQFVQRIGSLLLFGIWAARQYSRKSIELGANPLLLPACLLCGVISAQFVTGLSAYRYATLSAALNLVPYGVVLLVAGEIFSRRKRLHDFALTMSVFGFLVALFAIIQDLSHSDRIYWIVKARGISAAIYGPYANHNHYAGLMEMLVPLAGAAAFLESGGKRALMLFATALMAVSIVFSRSRGGMLGLIVSVIFVCAVLFRMNRRERAALSVLGIIGIVALFAILLGNDSVFQRLAETQDNYRLAIYRDCLRMWTHHPILGFGWGTFSTVYPAYRSFFTDLFVNSAHNDYLELLVEMGLAGVVLTGWFLFMVFRSAFRKIFDPADYEGSVLATGVIAGIVALLAHSALDFNLHVCGNAAIFYALCSAVAVPYRRRLQQIKFTIWEPEGGMSAEEEA